MPFFPPLEEEVTIWSRMILWAPAAERPSHSPWMRYWLNSSPKRRHMQSVSNWRTKSSQTIQKVPSLMDRSKPIAASSFMAYSTSGCS